MYYPPRSEEQKRQRQRREEPSKEETDLRERIRESWPGDIVYNDGMDLEEVSGKTLRHILQEHDRPHRDVRNEVWHVNGTLLRSRKYAFAATLSLTAVNSSVNPPDESEDLNNFSTVLWSITDTSGPQSKYYRFSCFDHRAPVLLSALLAKGELGSVEDHLMQATVEQLNGDVLVCPDQCMQGPATVRFSELDLRFGSNFLRRLPVDPKAAPADVLATTRYHLHLEGRTHDQTDGDLEKEVKATLDVVYKPRVVPMLDGDHGVVGHGDWKDDMFCLSFPHMEVVECSLRITRASDDLELVRELEVRQGTIWMDHRFGGVVPRSTAEADYLRSVRKDVNKPREDVVVDRCMLRLFNAEQDCLAVTRVVPVTLAGDNAQEPREDRGARHVYSAVQSAQSRSAYGYWSTPRDRKAIEAAPTKNEGSAATAASLEASVHDVSFDPDTCKQYRSKETGMLFPLDYKIHTPMYNGTVADLTVHVAFPEQELVSSLLQPSAWMGVVTVEGTLTKTAPAGGDTGATATVVSTTPVTGEGFLECLGHGVVQNASALLDAMRAAATAPLEAAAVAEAGRGSKGWVRVAEGPALACVSTVSVVLSMQKMTLTNAQKVVLSAMLGVYGFVFHHHDNNQEEVEEALAWCQGKWLSFFGFNPINHSTLVLRAFMLRELARVMHARCAGWIPREAAALDIVAHALTASSSVEEGSEALKDKDCPTEAVLKTAPTGLEVSQLKALMEGKWICCDVAGSLSAVLVEQHVPVLWRNLMGKVQPTLDVVVDREKQRVTYTVTTIIEEVDRAMWVNGQEWLWRCPSRGQIRSRACVLAGGKQLYMESYVRQGVERIWYSFPGDGTTMEETICYYRSSTAEAPAAWCVRTYRYDKPKRPTK